MLTHGDWHDFTLSVLKCKEVRKIYRDHPYGLKPYHVISPYCFILHNTGATCSCISASLYEQIFKKVAMIEKHLKVGQADGASLGPKGLIKLLFEINNNHSKHLFIVCQNPKQLLLFGIIKSESIGIMQEHHTYSIQEEN